MDLEGEAEIDRRIKLEFNRASPVNPVKVELQPLIMDVDTYVRHAVTFAEAGRSLIKALIARNVCESYRKVEADNYCI